MTRRIGAHTADAEVGAKSTPSEPPLQTEGRISDWPLSEERPTLPIPAADEPSAKGELHAEPETRAPSDTIPAPPPGDGDGDMDDV